MFQNFCCPPIRTSPVVCPPVIRPFDTFIPREVPFIHPIVNVNRQHFADFPRHYFTQSNVTVPPRPGFGGGFPPYGRPF